MSRVVGDDDVVLMDWIASTITKESEAISVWMSVILMKSPPALQREYGRLSGLSHKRGQVSTYKCPYCLGTRGPSVSRNVKSIAFAMIMMFDR